MRHVNFHTAAVITFIQSNGVTRKTLSRIRTDNVVELIKNWRSYAPEGTTCYQVTPVEPAQAPNTSPPLPLTEHQADPEIAPENASEPPEGPESGLEGPAAGSPGREEEWKAYGYIWDQKPYLPVEMVRMSDEGLTHEGVASSWGEAAQYVSQRTNREYLQLCTGSTDNGELYTSVRGIAKAMAALLELLHDDRI